MEMVEEWKDIKGFENKYQVSNLGRVKSLQRTVKAKSFSTRTVQEHIMKLEDVKGQAMRVSLYDEGIAFRRVVHMLVAEAFLKRPQGSRFVYHKDGDYHNNRADNLLWIKK